MNWTVIENSTAIGRVGYDAAAETLAIETLEGKQYPYSPVPQKAYEEFMAEPSKGRAWGHIKKTYKLSFGANTHPSNGHSAPPAPTILPPAKEATPPIPASSLAISFEAAPASGSFPPVVFDHMVVNLRQQTDQFCAPVLARITELSNAALALAVNDAATYEQAALRGTELADQRRTITETLRIPKRSIDAVKAVFLDKEKQLLAEIERGELHLKNACTAWRTEAKRREQAETQAEQERKRKLAEDQRLADAQKAQDAGRGGLAEKLLSTPVAIPTVEVKSAVPTGTGARGKVAYKFRVLDLAAVPKEWMMLDEKTVAAFARTKKMADGTILNGIEFYQEEDTNF